MYEVFEHLLQSCGVSAYRFCKETGISQSTISTWKKKGNLIKGDLAKKIADYFNVSVDYLMTGEEKESDNKNAPVRQHRGLNRLHSRGMMQYVLLYCIIIGQPLQVNRSEFPKVRGLLFLYPFLRIQLGNRNIKCRFCNLNKDYTRI